MARSLVEVHSCRMMLWTTVKALMEATSYVRVSA